MRDGRSAADPEKTERLLSQFQEHRASSTKNELDHGHAMSQRAACTGRSVPGRVAGGLAQEALLLFYFFASIVIRPKKKNSTPLRQTFLTVGNSFGPNDDGCKEALLAVNVALCRPKQQIW